MSDARQLSANQAELQSPRFELTGFNADKPVGLNLLEIADKKKGRPVEQATPADKSPDTPRDMMQSFMSLPKEKLTPGLIATQAAVREFSAAQDKKEAIGTVGPKFEAAAAQSDQDYAKVMAENWSGVKSAQLERNRLESLFKAGMQDLGETVKALPADKQESTQAMLSLLTDDNISPQLRKSVREEMKKTPEVLKTFDATMKLAEQGAKAEEALAKASQPIEKAAYAQATTRMVAAKAYEMAGETSKSFLLKEEAKDILSRLDEQITGQKAPVKPALKV